MYASKNAGRMSAARQARDVLLAVLGSPDPAPADRAEATARAAGLSADECEAVRWAVELHPLGEDVIAAAPSLRAVARLVAESHAPESPPRTSSPRSSGPARARVRGRMAIGSDSTLLKTALYDRHVAAGAKLVPFAGWEMPVQYTGIKEEHLAVRTTAGVFDVSHMGEIETTGPGRRGASCSASSPTTSPRSPTTARSTACCARRTGASWTTSSPTSSATSRYLTVTNAANHEKDLAWFRKQAAAVRRHASTTALHDYAMLAVQGPEARGIVANLAEGELPKRFRTARLTVAGVPDVLVCGTGYTGEDGVELLIAPIGAVKVWDALLDAGVVPIGLGARDTLRLEVCLPPVRQRPDGDARSHRGRPRLVREGGHRLHRRGGDQGRPGQRPVRGARPVRHRAGHRPPGQRRARRRRGHLRHARARP